MIRISHHRKKCIGCNYCVEAAQYWWSMDNTDGKSNLLESKEKKGIYIVVCSDDEYEDNSEAAELCPVNIIRVEKIR